MRSEWLIKGYGYDIVLELFFATVCLAIFMLCLKIYKLTKSNQIKLLLFGFGFLTSANISIAIANTFNLIQVAPPFNFIYGYFGFYIIGLAFIASSVYKMKSFFAYLFVTMFTLIVGISSLHIPIIYFIMMFWTLAVILFKFSWTYGKRQTVSTLIITSGFVLITVGNVGFFIAFMFDSMYLVGHIANLVGYTLLGSETLRIYHKK